MSDICVTQVDTAADKTLRWSVYPLLLLFRHFQDDYTSKRTLEKLPGRLEFKQHPLAGSIDNVFCTQVKSQR
jgi:hypothetical protein